MGKQIVKYKEIENDILQQIQNGSLQPGDQILTESELCSRYQVSRMTARKALDLLASQCVLKRVAGKGTFVNFVKVSKTANTTRSFSNDMRSIGKVPGSIMVSYKVCRGSEIPDIAQELQLDPDNFIHCIVRIRTADDVKIALSYTYLPCTLFPSFDIRMLEGSLYDYIQQYYQIDPLDGSKTISAVIPTATQKKLLDIDDIPLLKITHPGYLLDGRCFEFTETYYIGTRFIYTYERTAGK